LCHRFPHGLEKYAERDDRYRGKQAFTIGEMLVGRGLPHAKLLRQRADVDRFGAAQFGLPERSLHQGISEIPMMIDMKRLAGGSGCHCNVILYNFSLDSAIERTM